MALEEVQRAFIMTNWAVLDLAQTKLAAHHLMNQWKWQAKVPGYKQKVNRMRSKDSIISFMWNATSSGMRYDYFNRDRY